MTDTPAPAAQPLADISPCGWVCGIPKDAHQTEEHPWVAARSVPDNAERKAIVSYLHDPDCPVPPDMAGKITRAPRSVPDNDALREALAQHVRTALGLANSMARSGETPSGRYVEVMTRGFESLRALAAAPASPAGLDVERLALIHRPITNPMYPRPICEDDGQEWPCKTAIVARLDTPEVIRG